MSPVSLESLHGRGIYFDVWPDVVQIDGWLKLEDLKLLVAYMEQQAEPQAKKLKGGLKC